MTHVQPTFVVLGHLALDHVRAAHFWGSGSLLYLALDHARSAHFWSSVSLLYLALDHACAADFWGSGSAQYREREAAFSMSVFSSYFCFQFASILALYAFHSIFYF